MAHAVGSVDHRENVVLPAHTKKGFKRQTNSRNGRHGVKDRNPRPFPLRFRCGNCIFKSLDTRRMAKRINNLYLPPRDFPSRFGDVGHGIAASGVDCGKVQNLVLAVVVPGNVTEDGVYAGSGIGNEDASIHRNVEERGDGFAGLVEKLRVSVQDECVWTSLGLLAKVIGYCGDGDGSCAEGTWGRVNENLCMSCAAEYSD